MTPNTAPASVAADLDNYAGVKPWEPAARRGPTSGEWWQRLTGSRARLLEVKPDVLMLGDSHTDQWMRTGRGAWERHLTAYRAAEYGIGGDTTSNLLFRLDDSVLSELAPRIVTILVGSNNLGHYSVEENVAGLLACVEAAGARFSAAKLFLQTLPPLDVYRYRSLCGDVEKINEQLRRADLPCAAVLIDTYHLFFEAFGVPLADAFEPDRRHLSAASYERLAEYLAGIFAEAIKPESAKAKLVEGQNYLYQPLAGSDRLLVSLNGRDNPPGQFNNFRNSEIFSCARLFFTTWREDFYQDLFEEMDGLITEICRSSGHRRVLYLGFSAGGFAALVLGMRRGDTERIISFSPQFKLDQSVTIAYRTIQPLQNGARFDPRYVDILQEVRSTNIRTDIFLGCYDVPDGCIVEDAAGIANRNVKVHFVRWEHNPAGRFEHLGLFEAILADIRDDNEITVPPDLIADDDDVRLAVASYRLLRELTGTDGPVAMPDLDDHRSRNARWFNVKARALHRNGDHLSALVEIWKACIYPCGERDEDFICAGNIAFDAGRLDLAVWFYQSAHQHAGGFCREAALGLARLHAVRGERAQVEACAQSGLEQGMRLSDFAEYLSTVGA